MIYDQNKSFDDLKHMKYYNFQSFRMIDKGFFTTLAVPKVRNGGQRMQIPLQADAARIHHFKSMIGFRSGQAGAQHGPQARLLHHRYR
jgi:hypothetical protein